MEIKELRKSEAIRYLGYGENQPDKSVMELIDECEKQLLQVIEPKFTYKIFEISEINKTEGFVTLKDCALRLEGRDIASHLDGCEKAVFMACTVSAGVDRLLRITQVRDMTKAVIMDSLASAAIEQVCDEAQAEIMNNIDGYNTWRFSCGYGDLPIESQKMFVSVLDAPKRIGLNTTDSCMLVPSKSVTAVFGISEKPVERRKLGCESCNLKGKCNFRKRGERCEF